MITAESKSIDNFAVKPGITKQEFLLLLLSVIFTVLVTLGLIRWIAPGLLGVTPDLVLVKSDEHVQPFYENIFRDEHRPERSFMHESGKLLDFFLPDPYTKVRARPLFPDIGGAGPNDLLGFRNTDVPVTAQIVVIGDSQTYGNNAVMWKNWPHSLQLMLPPGNRLYSMATGSWAATQYYYAFKKALYFSPRLVIIAFYTGNDPLETYSMATASDYWTEFLPGKKVQDIRPPEIHFPPREDELWTVNFADGISTRFAPQLRHSSNLEHPAVDNGYEIMSRVASRIFDDASKRGVLRVLFTIIPTKELVYSRKVTQEVADVDADYLALVKDEKKRIHDFAGHLRSLGGSSYVDVVTPLMEAAMTTPALYPEDINGHPLAAGYHVIAAAMAPLVSQLLDGVEDGFYTSESQTGLRRLVYIEAGRFWFITNPEGLKEKYKPGPIASRRLASMRFAGHLTMDN